LFEHALFYVLSVCKITIDVDAFNFTNAYRTNLINISKMLLKML
jgi:hypothetical protein